MDSMGCPRSTGCGWQLVGRNDVGTRHPVNRPHTWAVFVLVGVGLAACGSEPIDRVEFNQPLNLAQPWQTAEPAAVGLDEAALNRAGATLEAEQRSLSLLVVRSGRLAYERYFHGNHADSLNDVRSVTKSVVSTLVGIALERGLLPDLNQTLGDLLPPGRFALTPAQAQISLRHLLTMSGGFEWAESGSTGYNEWITSGDHIGFLLEKPIVAQPGSTFTYNSAAVHLLGVALAEAAGQPIEQLADEWLFGPLGISRVRWEVVSDGYANGGAGIDLRPRDLARLGQLALQDGVSGTASLTEGDWFARAGAPAFTFRFQAPGISAGSYGFLWWTESGAPEPAFFAWGHGGQYIYVVPSLDLVVVATTEWRGAGAEAGPQAGRVLETVVNQVVAAAR